MVGNINSNFCTYAFSNISQGNEQDKDTLLATLQPDGFILPYPTVDSTIDRESSLLLFGKMASRFQCESGEMEDNKEVES